MPDKTILLRCISGEASPEEAMLVDSWLNASKENKQEFDALWQLWQKTVDKTGYVVPDKTEAWNEVRVRIHLTSAPPSQVPFKLIFHPQIWKVLITVLAGGIIAGIILIKSRPEPAGRPPVKRHTEKPALSNSLPGHRNSSMEEHVSDSVFSFTNSPLKEVAVVLSRAYKVNIQLENSTIGECRITGQFDHLPIKNVLEIIAATLNITFTIQQQGKVIYLNGKGCE
jgi:Domain of unknown function (DUF4974)